MLSTFRGYGKLEDKRQSKGLQEHDALFLGRVCEGLQCNVNLFLFPNDSSELKHEMNKLTVEFYTSWGESLLTKLDKSLEAQLLSDTWKHPGSWRDTHGGWDKFEIELDDADEEEEMEEHSNNNSGKSKEEILLPTAVTPCIFRFIVELRNKISALGDIFSFKSLDIEQMGSITATATTGVSTEPEEEEDIRSPELEAKCLNKFLDCNRVWKGEVSSMGIERIIDCLKKVSFLFLKAKKKLLCWLLGIWDSRW